MRQAGADRPSVWDSFRIAAQHSNLRWRIHSTRWTPRKANLCALQAPQPRYTCYSGSITS